MNSIQQGSSIKSSRLYIKNKKFGMSKEYMPNNVPNKNNYIGYNFNDNYTQGFQYVGDMYNQTLIGKPSVYEVQRTAKKSKDSLRQLLTNRVKTMETFDNYDGIIPMSNSTITQLYALDKLNVDISNNITNIDKLYTNLSGNCLAASSEADYKNCIKYNFSTHKDANITKKIQDKNQAYLEDVTEVQLQQNNIYVLGAITTASLLIFAIMLGKE
jgi:hypothetical protein